MTKTIRFETTAGEVHLGRVVDQTIHDAAAAPAIGFDATPEAWEIIRTAAGTTYSRQDVKVLAPGNTRKLVAIGRNYRSHVEETNLKHPDAPVVFAKFPSSVTGPGDEIVIPREESRPDFEGEVGIVNSKRCYRVAKEDAWDYVGGFTALNDVSGRRAQLETP